MIDQLIDSKIDWLIDIDSPVVLVLLWLGVFFVHCLIFWFIACMLDSLIRWFVDRFLRRIFSKVRSLGEMFLGTDTFVAIVSSIGMADGAGMDQTFRENRKITPRKQTIHNPSKYDIITGEGKNELWFNNIKFDRDVCGNCM